MTRVAAALLASVLWPSGADAQTSLQVPLQFDFVNPGAKSLALGGAFTGLADDATATFANPAGLTLLLGPELSLAQTVVTDDDALLASMLKGNDLLWGAALVVGLVLFAGWLGAVASYWARALGNRPPRVPAFLTLVAASAVLSAFMSVFYIARDSTVVIEASVNQTKAEHAAVAETAWAGPVWLWQALLDPAFLYVVLRPFILPGLVLLWVVPLAAVFLARRRRDGPVDWAFLERGGELQQPALALRVLRPLAIGLALTLIHLISIPVTNTSVNPARSTGPALIVGGWALNQLWLFWVAPILGAAAAGGFWRWLNK